MAKKSFIILLLIQISISAFTQGVRVNLYGMPIVDKDSIGEVRLHVQYHVQYRDAKEDPLLAEDLQALDIGSQVSRYSSNPAYYCFHHIPLEPGQTAPSREAQEMAFRESLKYKEATGIILRHYPKAEQLSYYKAIWMDGFSPDNNFYYTEDNPQQDWTLEEGDTTICGYACQPATATFRGRTWKVWYALDLPYEEGPWKLGGLPGLILKAEDATGEYSFTSIEITQPKGQAIRDVDPSIFQKASEKKIQEVISAYYKNPIGFMTMQLSEETIKSIEQTGVKLTNSQRTPCFIETVEK